MGTFYTKNKAKISKNKFVLFTNQKVRKYFHLKLPSNSVHRKSRSKAIVYDFVEKPPKKTRHSGIAAAGASEVVLQPIQGSHVLL
jgi:hypothetical protein